uniref:Uncharacterized protein n=1 Tax=Laticauda laticaudata TaxID=8630 RepID=A0A8C5RTQ6_LATLA
MSPSTPIQGSSWPPPRGPLYVCPGYKKEMAHRKKCRGDSAYFCADWDCVSMGEITWDPPLKNNFIMLKRTGEKIICVRNQRGVYQNCNPVKIYFTPQGKRYRGWQAGVTWGGRIFDKDGDPGNLFTIKLMLTPTEPPVPVGPKTILTDHEVPPPRPTDILEKGSPPSIGYTKIVIQLNFILPLKEKGTGGGRLGLVNDTNPNLTIACWFCYNVQPLYYEAAGLISPYNTSSDDTACRWKHGSQTLRSISGKGTCIGQVPTQYEQYCNTTYSEIDTTLLHTA